ncbi:MAG: Spi family protease inhibitor, partial [Marinoscillum sp.]
MKKINYSLLSMLLILLIASCNHEELEDQNDTTKKFLLKIEDARQIAKNLNLKNPYESKISEPSLRKTYNSIREESTISDGDLPNYYVFNYENNSGFSIISA